MYTRVKTDAEIVSMRESGRMLATVLDVVNKSIVPNVSTKDLAEIAKQELKVLGGQPPFLGYYGFPDVICISVNEEIVHGIPRVDKILQTGDIVSLDFGVTYKGMITDSARTYFVDGPRNKQEQKLAEVTEASLYAGIDVVRDGVAIGTIANAIESVIKPHRYGIVRDLVGHGVGHELHEEPNIPNYGRANTGPKLQAGMTIAIEPMVIIGGDHRVVQQKDGWTIVSRDKSRAAHYEHTILITETGAEILTLSQN